MLFIVFLTQKCDYLAHGRTYTNKLSQFFSQALMTTHAATTSKRVYYWCCIVHLMSGVNFYLFSFSPNQDRGWYKKPEEHRTTGIATDTLKDPGTSLRLIQDIDYQNQHEELVWNPSRKYIKVSQKHDIDILYNLI
jgi:hypothetical protein